MYGVQSIPGMGLSAHIRKLCVYKQKDFYSGGVPYVDEKKAEPAWKSYRRRLQR